MDYAPMEGIGSVMLTHAMNDQARDEYFHNQIDNFYFPRDITTPSTSCTSFNVNQLISLHPKSIVNFSVHRL